MCDRSPGQDDLRQWESTGSLGGRGSAGGERAGGHTGQAEVCPGQIWGAWVLFWFFEAPGHRCRSPQEGQAAGPRQQVPGSRSSCLQHRAEHGGSGESEGFSRRVGVPGVRRAPRKVWERLADRKANSLAASTEKYLVCFVS